MSWNKEYKLPGSVSASDIAYTAGLLDGEGCLNISKQKAGTDGRINVSHRFIFKITVGQKEVIEWLRDTFKAGSVHVQKHKKFNDGYNWWVSSLQAIAILKILRPHLKIKAVEADIAFEFAETYWQRGSSKRLPKKVIDKREALYWKLRKAKPSYKFRVNSKGS